MSDFDTICDEFFSEIDTEVDGFLERIGSEAERINRSDGNYRNHTGRLRNSNYHKVEGHTLELGNSAPYASKVSSKGYDVVDSGIQYLKKELEDML